MNTTQNTPEFDVREPAAAAREKRFDWPLCYGAEQAILAELETFLARNHFARQLAERMRRESGTLLLDWVDYLIVPRDREDTLRTNGYTDDPLAETAANQTALWHPEAMLPRVLLHSQSLLAVAIRTESVSDFMAVHAIPGEPEGEPLSRFRRIPIALENGTLLEAVERR